MILITGEQKRNINLANKMFARLKPGVYTRRVLEKKLAAMGVTSSSAHAQQGLHRRVLEGLQHRLLDKGSDYRLIVVGWREWGDQVSPTAYEKIARVDLIERRRVSYRRNPPMISRGGRR